MEYILRELNCTACIPYHILLTQERIDKIKQETETNIFMTWTVNDPERAKILYGYGVNVMITDHAERLRHLNPNYLLENNASFFKSVLIENRHHDAQMQHEYDKQFGLSVI